MNMFIHMSSKKYDEGDYGYNLALVSSHTKCIFHILQEVGAETKKKKKVSV